MSKPSQTGDAAQGRSKPKLTHLRNKRNATSAQPGPTTPGVTRQMVRVHARRLFRDKWPQRPLSLNQWRLAERDLIQALEGEAF